MRSTGRKGSWSERAVRAGINRSRDQGMTLDYSKIDSPSGDTSDTVSGLIKLRNRSSTLFG